MADTVAIDLSISNSAAIKTTNELTADPLIDFEATSEFREQFQVWKDAKLKEVLAYLHNNWNLKEVTIDRLVMTPQFVFPDREKRNEYGQVAPGQTFVDANGNVVPHPVTGQPIIFTVWRKVDLPAVDGAKKPEIELTPPPAAAI